MRFCKVAYNELQPCEGGEFNHKSLIELQNLILTENPPFFIHAVSGWAYHKTKIMTQKEFIELSEKEVLSLNGYSNDENVTEAWRGGYIYMREKLREFYQNMYQDEFFENVEKILEDEINEFNDDFS